MVGPFSSLSYFPMPFRLVSLHIPCSYFVRRWNPRTVCPLIRGIEVVKDGLGMGEIQQGAAAPLSFAFDMALNRKRRASRHSNPTDFSFGSFCFWTFEGSHFTCGIFFSYNFFLVLTALSLCLLLFNECIRLPKAIMIRHQASVVSSPDSRASSFPLISTMMATSTRAWFLNFPQIDQFRMTGFFFLFFYNGPTVFFLFHRMSVGGGIDDRP